MAQEEAKTPVTEQKEATKAPKVDNIQQAKQTAAQAKAEPAESVYTAEELANNAKNIFGTRKECVAAALKVANVTECTVSKAKEIVEKFLNKEVK